MKMIAFFNIYVDASFL